jgi:hypothetical protein
VGIILETRSIWCIDNGAAAVPLPRLLLRGASYRVVRVVVAGVEGEKFVGGPRVVGVVEGGGVHRARSRLVEDTVTSPPGQPHGAEQDARNDLITAR